MAHSHCLNQCSLTANWSFTKTIQWNLNLKYENCISMKYSWICCLQNAIHSAQFVHDHVRVHLAFFSLVTYIFITAPGHHWVTGQGGGYWGNFRHSIFPSFFQHYQNTGYLFNMIFIFDRCCHSLAVVTPVKYEYDLKNSTSTLVKIKNFSSKKIMDEALVTPTHCLLTCSISQELCTWFVLCCVLLWFGFGWFYPYPSGLLHWHWGIHMISPVPVK